MYRNHLANLLSYLIDLVMSLIVLALGLRFLLRLLGANPASEFVTFIYSATAPLLEPFRTMFAPLAINPGSVWEFTTIIAILIYLIVGWLLSEFILFIAYLSTSYRGEKS